MKLRESGMPEEMYWETFFDTDLILNQLEIDHRLGDMVELGCGYGTFTLPVAKRINGILRTYDIDAAVVERTRRRARDATITNIVAEIRDVFGQGFGGAAASQDACLLFNILHSEEPVRLLFEAARVIRPGGHIHVIHWRHDPSTPRGPSLEIRPLPQQIISWARETQLLEPIGPALDLPPWHYGLRFQRAPAGY